MIFDGLVTQNTACARGFDLTFLGGSTQIEACTQSLCVNLGAFCFLCIQLLLGVNT